MKFVKVEAGDFLMGSPEDEPGRFNDEKQHPVTIDRDFFMKTTPVTEKEWKDVMGNNPSHKFDRPGGESADDCPVQCVNWYDAIAFCNKLSELEGLAPYYSQSEETGTPGEGNYQCEVSINIGSSGYRLPTEAEWEYACRGGPGGQVVRGDDSTAWYRDNSGSRTRPVATKEPNPLGLYDMFGNVWEWCWDVYDKDYNSE